jgi:hypothetical protein
MAMRRAVATDDLFAYEVNAGDHLGYGFYPPAGAIVFISMK